ncbi:MAG: hypothetical protein WB729_06710 [Candidatus Sulfotelmatobacter sp.]
MKPFWPFNPIHASMWLPDDCANAATIDWSPVSESKSQRRKPNGRKTVPKINTAYPHGESCALVLGKSKPAPDNGGR